MMSEPTTVDKTTVDELTGKLVLLIEENRPWRETELMHRQLSAKVRHYVRHIRSEKFAQEHGQRPQDTIVRLVSAERPDDNSLQFLRRIAYELSKHGIELEHQIGEHSIPVSLTAAAVTVEPEILAVPETPPPPASRSETREAEVAAPEDTGPAAVEAAEPPAAVEEPPPTEAVEPEPAVAEPAELEPAEVEPVELAAPEELAETPPAFARPESLEAEAVAPGALFRPEPSALDEPSELETLLEGAGEEGLGLVDLPESEEPMAVAEPAGAPSGKKATQPTFLPEEEFGRALPDVDEVEAILMSASTEPAIIETSSGKRILLDVGDAASGPSAAAVPEDRPSLLRGIGAALIAAFAGAVVWAGLSAGAGHGASLLALVIGLMVGISVRLRGGGHTMPFRIVGVLGTLLGSLLGGILASAALSAWQDNLGVGGILDNLSSVGSALAVLDRQYAPIDLAAVALALYIAFKLSASKPPADAERAER